MHCLGFKREGKTSAETADMADVIKLSGKEKIMEKQHLDTGVLHAADEKFEKETNVYQSKLQEKEDNLLEGSLLVENSAVQEVAPKKRKASMELESPKYVQKLLVDSSMCLQIFRPNNFL